MRAVDYATVAVKDLQRQLLRSFLTIVALIISTVILVTMIALSIGGQRAVVDQFGAGNALTSITVTPNQSAAGLNPFGTVQEVNSQATKLTDATASELAKIPHVQSSVPRTFIWELNTFSVEGYTKQFVAKSEGAPADNKIPLKAGTHFTSNTDKNVVILGSSYVKELGLAATPELLIGKTINIITQKGYRGDGAAIPPLGTSAKANEEFSQSTTSLQAKIIGISDNGPDQNALLVPLEWARDIRTARYNTVNGLKTVDQLAEKGYTSIQVRVDDTDNVAAVSHKITELGYGQFSALEQVQRIQQLTTIMWVILGTVALVAAVAAALGVTNTMLMTVSEQKYTIGVWRAVGARRGLIVRLFLVQAGLLGLIGGLVGVGLGALIMQYVDHHVNTLLSSQGLQLTNIAELPLWLVGGAIFATTLFGILAGLYPAYRAAHEDPSDALRAGQ